MLARGRGLGRRGQRSRRVHGPRRRRGLCGGRLDCPERGPGSGGDEGSLSAVAPDLGRATAQTPVEVIIQCSALALGQLAVGSLGEHGRDAATVDLVFGRQRIDESGLPAGAADWDGGVGGSREARGLE